MTETINTGSKRNKSTYPRKEDAAADHGNVPQHYPYWTYGTYCNENSW